MRACANRSPLSDESALQVQCAYALRVHRSSAYNGKNCVSFVLASRPLHRGVARPGGILQLPFSAANSKSEDHQARLRSAPSLVETFVR